MPIIKSAKKRVRVARKATVRNAKTKRNLRLVMKAFESSANSETFNKAQSALDVAAKKGLMHKNKVARKKRQLASAAKAAGVKVTATAKKSTAKPAAKSVAKKPATKKPATTKSASKKPTTK
jgi:small subunit ribosomal protein S20